MIDLGAVDTAAQLVLFVGAGMSAESGVPTYRGAGGIWGQYRYQDYACQRAFDRQPAQVLDFHEMRRSLVHSCLPHAGHAAIASLQHARPDVYVITQNIDGLLQRAGVAVEVELHGSLWRLRCPEHGVHEDRDAGPYRHRHCPQCGRWLRPDITWFEDAVDTEAFARAQARVSRGGVFVSIGTSAVVWPAAGFIDLARQSGATMIELNPEATEASSSFELKLRGSAGELLPALLDQLRPPQ